MPGVNKFFSITVNLRHNRTIYEIRKQDKITLSRRSVVLCMVRPVCDGMFFDVFRITNFCFVVVIYQLSALKHTCPKCITYPSISKHTWNGDLNSQLIYVADRCFSFYRFSPANLVGVGECTEIINCMQTFYGKVGRCGETC